MAFEAEQYRQLQALGEPAGGPARVTAMGVAVQVHPDADAFAASPGSQLDPAADPGQEPPPHYRERGWSWPPRLAAESFMPTASSPAPPRPGPVPACPAPSSKPGTTSARSPGSRSPSPPSAPPDSRPTCAWPAASIPACQRPATSSAAPSSCPPPSTPPPSTAGSMSSDEAAADAPDPEHAAFVRLSAGAASGGRDRVMSRAARELRTRGTAHSGLRSCPMTTWPASARRRRSPRPSCVPPACGSASPAAAACSTGKRSRCAQTGCANSGRRPGPRPGTGTRSSPPCAVLRNAVHAHRTGGTSRIPRRVGAAAQHRLALACPYPRGLGWADVRPSGQGAGHVPRLARRGSLRDRARVPVRARRQQRGDDRRRRRDQEEPHPVRPVHDRRGSGRHPGQPLTRWPARAMDGINAPHQWSGLRSCVFTGWPGWRLSAGELDDRARPHGAGGRTWRRTGLSRSAG